MAEKEVDFPCGKDISVKRSFYSLFRSQSEHSDTQADPKRANDMSYVRFSWFDMVCLSFIVVIIRFF